jgi:hypothetical protein
VSVLVEEFRLDFEQIAIPELGDRLVASNKTQVIQYLFEKYWDPVKEKLTKSVMTFKDVQQAIRYCNRNYGTKLSDRNPANFMKDIVRGKGASRNWPDRLHKLRFTAVQTPGDGNAFEFRKYAPDQLEAFPDPFTLREETPSYVVQSVSMPLSAKGLGRSDEPWLIQTAVNLRVIETHFAVSSRVPVIQITHLQMSVKLRKTEIDAIFLAICKNGSKEYPAIITCEAKQARERILEHQIVNQVKAAFEETDVEVVIPLALQALRRKGFHVVEFEHVTRAESKSLSSLRVAARAAYELRPPVPGI